MNSKQWNQRYVEFANSNGRIAEEQFAIDSARSSGCMCDFLCWSMKNKVAK
jgi:hypothetical protein